MEKKYKIESDSITGVRGNIFKKGQEVKHSFLLNHDDHLAQGHITECGETVQGVKEESAIAGTGEAIQMNNDGTAPVKKLDKADKKKEGE